MAEAGRSGMPATEAAEVFGWERDEPMVLALGPGMSFEGLLVLPRAARIEGHVGGEVLAGGPVWVGPGGEVDADLEADTMIVEGRVNGSLRARHAIALGPTAVVRGDLAAPLLRIAEGARVDGRCLCGAPAARSREVSSEAAPTVDRGLGAS